VTRIGIIGGTGAFGSGLAARLALAGHTVVVGSRSPERAERTSTELRQRWNITGGLLCGADNAAAANCELAVISVPASVLEEAVLPLADLLANKVVLSTVNRFPGSGVAFSATEEIQARAPKAHVGTALNHLSAKTMGNAGTALDAEVLVAASSDLAHEQIASLVDTMPNLRAVAAGDLSTARAIEEFAPVVMNLRRKYGPRTSIRVVTHS
jgi:8-hydroxy-5-deazaflavin:NADPH oxidoreductase